MITFDEVCRDLAINLVNPCQNDFDKLMTYCQLHVSQDCLFYGDLQQKVTQCSDFIQLYLEKFLPNVNEDDLCCPVPAFNQMSSLEYMARNGLDRYLSHCHPTSSEINTLFGLMSPLHISATYGYKYTTRDLLALGAKATTANERNELPLHYALELPMLYEEALVNRKHDIFINLYKSAPETLAIPMEDGSTLLHKMACNGYSDLLSIAMNINPNLVLKANNFGSLPVHTAILNGQLEATKILLNAKNPEGMTDFQHRNPLHYAAAFSTPEMLALCLSVFKSSLETKDKQGCTPFMLAAYYGNLANLETLLETIPNPLAEKDNYGKNALQIAIHENQIGVVDRLLQLPGSEASLNEDDRQALQLLKP